MRLFAGQFERTIDAKNRVQLPAQLRCVVDPEREGTTLYVTLAESIGTLAIFTTRGFEELASRLETEYSTGPDARRFELQFYSLASPVEIDKQGRIVLPDRLRRKAGLGEEVYLIGQKNRIEIWNRAALDRDLGIDWEGEDWPQWQSFLRRRPGSTD
ncbi:MAG: division/cell wall cluster transcriptional repressor MraZ [Phycisphaerae bacterium]